MKYWDELNELDTSLVELDLIKSNLRLIANGAECSNFADILSALECVTSNFENALSEARDNFQYLFGIIRSDGNAVSTLQTNDYVEPSEGVLELDSIVRGWSNK